MNIKSKKKRAVIQRCWRGRFTQLMIAKGEVNKRQAKRWITQMYNKGELNDY